MSLLKTFGDLKGTIKIKPQRYIIDNWVFKLHYKATVIFFLVGSILVTSRQYIGEHIRCISDKGVPDHVMNTFCFFTTTFTVIKAMDANLLDTGNLAHPGVGPYGIDSNEPVIHHAYYQWVPFVLFFQGLMFYLTHLLWKKLEGGRLRYLVDSLRYSAFSLQEKEIKVGSNNIPSKSTREQKINQVRQLFIDGMYINKYWAVKLMICEILNLLHVVLQFYITDKFLGGRFNNLGSTVWAQGLDSSVDVLDEVFPKITKCTFHKYGPSGSIQYHDAMCVMALNIINDKIYTGLWFWFIFLFVCSILGLIWRVITIIFHSRSTGFNRLVFSNSCPGKQNPWNALNVSYYYSYTDWLFLVYLAKNIDSLVFKEILLGIAEDLEQKKSMKQPLLQAEELDKYT
ncbi:innexin inx7 isoform X2 [Diorhabda carinulata]|uniref:innexin inx7 isoform X2 n=1 Tax=Diorhabda sublineata TaxID=1163346 RepID=UPI0024E0E127|nr:innexin inx7 isoform X2 [Diorhabda sublineata]XP_056638221.1 innexin inx7 isoform X2 [Diorhabda sublineata]XP_056638222.1 innexin inx7 isoform X2 [Diorhabda sublineata]XP_057653755.1 innexin inx7 isoform X2 [Diorhabda carinulata]XP_057653756.1 innexin inx7 isoform X2 [Diorhabda carinulata]XP_057653758.1 innexin inx7 isoform X2 [Diorhabda carinulata]XP_057653759.1 innexin inx7 isoform X2 [Diorhabda carinulata]XP_057653760.1 innexin inx7 isoform X2 [Diorhabda carinulata]XP_057653761.1 inne